MVGHRTAIFLAVVGLYLGLDGGSRAVAAEPQASESAATDAGAVRQRAKQLYEAGLAAYRDGKFSDAIDKLLEANQVLPNAAFAYNIALVYEAMGDQRSALRWLRGYLREVTAGADRSDALVKMRKFELQLQARGLQQVTILSQPSGATLTIDGHALGITPFTTELTPGSHVASLMLNGYGIAQRAFELRPDRSMDLEFALSAAEPVAAGEPAPVPPPAALVPATPSPEPAHLAVSNPALSLVGSPSDRDTHRQPPRVRPWTWATVGVGTALLGGALIFEVKRRRAEDAAEAAPQTAYQSSYDRIESPMKAARVLAVAGSVVVATGLVLLTVDLTRHGPVQTATVAVCGPSGFCAGLRGQF